MLTARRPRSLARRVLTGELLAVVALALLLPWLLWSSLGAVARQQERAMLLDQAQTLAAQTVVAGARVSVRPTMADEPGFASGYDGRSFRVVEAGGAAPVRSRFAAMVPWQALGRARTSPHYASTDDFALLALPVTLGGRVLRIEVAQDRNRPGAIVDDVERAFLPRVLALIPVLLLLPVLSALAFRSTVRRVRASAAGAAAIVDHRSIERIDGADLPSEVRPLVEAINALLVRLKAAYDRQAEFTGNVVHELRTPLQTLTLRLGEVPAGEARERSVAQVRRIRHIVAQLNDLSTLDDPASETRAPTDLNDAAREAVAEAAGDAIGSGHHIAFEAAAAPAIVDANRTLVELAISNLVRNAATHTPAGCTITVAVDALARRVEVADDGPGFAHPPETLRQRHLRSPEAQSWGKGLGLAIVDRVMAYHGGTLGIETGATGTRARLCFAPDDPGARDA